MKNNIQGIKYSFITLTLLLIFSILPGNGLTAAENDVPTTGFEGSDGEQWTSHQEELDFLIEVVEKSERITSTQIGTSSVGSLPLDLIKVGSPVPSSDEDIAEGQSVLIIGSQHGNEPAGREMALKMLRDLAFTDDAELVEQLKDTTVLFIPSANPDGRERNKRRNGNGVDLNRDHLHLYSPEGQAKAEVINQYDPDIVVDAHERNSNNPEMEVQWTRNLNMDVPLRELNEEMVDGSVRSDLEKNGFTDGLYGGHTHSTLGLETVLSQMTGLRHSLGMLTESAKKRCSK